MLSHLRRLGVEHVWHSITCANGDAGRAKPAPDLYLEALDGLGLQSGEAIAFEDSLHQEGTVLVKFWLHTSAKEQLKRFEARRGDPLKQWKLTDEDWRNRKQRAAYEEALEETFARTDRPNAPWTVIAGESKPFARVQVLDTVIAAIETGMRANGVEPISS